MSRLTWLIWDVAGGDRVVRVQERRRHGHGGSASAVAAAWIGGNLNGSHRGWADGRLDSRVSHGGAGRLVGLGSAILSRGNHKSWVWIADGGDWKHDLIPGWVWNLDRGDWKLNATSNLELWRVVDIAVAKVLNLQVVGASSQVIGWDPLVGASGKGSCTMSER